MNHLVITCHPRTSSFTRAIADTVEAVSVALGHDTRRRDLYALDFEAVLRATDLDALATGSVPPDIRLEQEFLQWTDMLTLVYPIWWAGMPALLKGYIDRVLCPDFVFERIGDSPLGPLAGKKVLIFNTTGAPSTFYASQDMHQCMASITDTGIFEICGMEVLHHAFFGGVTTIPDNELKTYLANVEAITSRYL
ncbi:MAG: flavodoxin family protein [Deltaproteobacteria bacterium]|nr:flavodoxin family protein [Deltaproteobacteria bacterium]